MFYDCSLGSNIAEEDEEAEEFEEEKDDINLGTVTMLSQQRQHLRSYSPSCVRELARNVALSKTLRKKVRSSTVNIPGPSEGVLPPDARPVTAYEALHHLAKRVRRGKEMVCELTEHSSMCMYIQL